MFFEIFVVWIWHLDSISDDLRRCLWKPRSALDWLLYCIIRCIFFCSLLLWWMSDLVVACFIVSVILLYDLIYVSIVFAFDILLLIWLVVAWLLYCFCCIVLLMFAVLLVIHCSASFTILQHCLSPNIVIAVLIYNIVVYYYTLSCIHVYCDVHLGILISYILLLQICLVAFPNYTELCWLYMCYLYCSVSFTILQYIIYNIAVLFITKYCSASFTIS